MSASYIPAELRRQVARQACYRCGYCLTAEAIVGTPMDFEHIIPECKGGLTEEKNLWLACSLCNSYKGTLTEYEDPVSGQVVKLFNPRRQAWNEHFEWIDGGTCILGLTSLGRATVAALQLNREPLVFSRKKWVVAGWHPPSDLSEKT